MKTTRCDQPSQIDTRVHAPRGAFAVLGVVVWGAGALVVLIDLMKPCGSTLSLSWLWLALFSVGAILILGEFFRHWRQTLRPMSAALFIAGGAIAAIDLGGLAIRRTYFACIWGPLLGLAVAGYLLASWLEKRYPGRLTRLESNALLISSIDGHPQDIHRADSLHNSR